MKYYMIISKKSKKLPTVKGDCCAGLYGTKDAAQSWLGDTVESKNWIVVPVGVEIIEELVISKSMAKRLSIQRGERC